NRIAERRPERLGQVEALPRIVAEVGGRQHPAAAHHAGKADRDTIEGAERRHEVREHLHDFVGRGADRRQHARPVGQHLPVIVDDRGLQPGAADVDRERAPACDRLRVVAVPGVGHDVASSHFLYVSTATPTNTSRRNATSGLPDCRCFSMASSESPVVSGTRGSVNRIPLRQITANRVNVKASPGPASISGKANTTTKLKPQLLIEAMLMPGPRARKGKISDIMTCGSGPTLMAKEAM